MEDRWSEREFILNQKHEEILQRRAALLKGSECYYDLGSKKSASFIMNIRKAMERNNCLVEELDCILGQLRRDNRDSQKFSMLKNNYWTMVRNVFPVWYGDLCEYEARKQRPLSKGTSSTTTANRQQHAGTSINNNNQIVEKTYKSTTKQQKSTHGTKSGDAGNFDKSHHRSLQENLDGNRHDDDEQRSKSKSERKVRSSQSLPRLSQQQQQQQQQQQRQQQEQQQQFLGKKATRFTLN